MIFEKTTKVMIFFYMLSPRLLSFLEYTEIPTKWNAKKLYFDCKIRNVLVDSYTYNPALTFTGTG